MTQAVTSIGDLQVLPALFAPTPDAARRYVEFFTANIRNPHTRRAYARAAAEFGVWYSGPAGIAELRDIEPVHVASYIEALGLAHLAPMLGSVRHGVVNDVPECGDLSCYEPQGAFRE